MTTENNGMYMPVVPQGYYAGPDFYGPHYPMR